VCPVPASRCAPCRRNLGSYNDKRGPAPVPVWVFTAAVQIILRLNSAREHLPLLLIRTVSRS
jgi:hypothetical protein